MEHNFKNNIFGKKIHTYNLNNPYFFKSYTFLNDTYEQTFIISYSKAECFLVFFEIYKSKFERWIVN